MHNDSSDKDQAKFDAYMQSQEELPPNDSGQGDSRLPDELRGLNWGALLLNFAWGLGMKVPFIYLILFFVPFLGSIMPLVYWVKGNEWAWKYRRWESVDHFRRVQDRWTWWGVVLLVVGMLLSIVMMKWIESQFKGMMLPIGI